MVTIFSVINNKMESAFDLLKRLSELRNDIHESTRKITNMLETIEEEKSMFPTEPLKLQTNPISYRHHRTHHHHHNTRKSIENELKRKNDTNLTSNHKNENGIDRKKPRCG